MTWVSDEADLDALIARIQSDLRSGRHPAERSSRDHELRLRSALRAIRGRTNRRTILLNAASRWLVPALIVLVVAAAVLLSGAK